MGINKQFYYKNNRLQQLKGFYYTAQLQNIVKSAKKIGLTSSSISLQIKTLERDLKTKLFDRKNGKMILTNDGQKLYKLSAPCLQAVDGMFEQFLYNKKNEEDQIINIAAHHIAISYLLPQYLRPYMTENKSITINIHNISKTQALQRLKEDEIDIMIYPFSKIPEECVFKPIASYDPLLIMHKDHPLSKVDEAKIELKDLAKYNFIRIDSEQIVLPMFEETLKQYGIGSNISFENGEWTMLKNFIREKMGLAMVSTICYKSEYDIDIIGKKMNKFFPIMTYGIMIKKGKFLNNATKIFIKKINPSFFEEMCPSIT